MSKLQELIKTINRKVGLPEQEKYMKKLATELGKNKTYYCVSTWTINEDELYPLLGTIDSERKCIYVFTDIEEASLFGKINNICSPDGKQVLTISLPVESLKHLLQKYKETGVDIVVINDGSDGLYILIDGFMKMLTI